MGSVIFLESYGFSKDCTGQEGFFEIFNHLAMFFDRLIAKSRFH